MGSLPSTHVCVLYSERLQKACVILSLDVSFSKSASKMAEFQFRKQILGISVNQCNVEYVFYKYTKVAHCPDITASKTYHANLAYSCPIVRCKPCASLAASTSPSPSPIPGPTAVSFALSSLLSGNMISPSPSPSLSCEFSSLSRASPFKFDPSSSIDCPKEDESSRTLFPPGTVFRGTRSFHGSSKKLSLNNPVFISPCWPPLLPRL